MLEEIYVKDLLERIEATSRSDGRAAPSPVIFESLELASLEGLFPDTDWVADLKSRRNANAHYQDLYWEDSHA